MRHKLKTKDFSPEFEAFRDERYCMLPWDCRSNPYGVGYEEDADNRSDIVCHLGVLEYFASKCVDVIELGTRNGHSTAAFLSTAQYVISVDIRKTEAIRQLEKMAQEGKLPCHWIFKNTSSTDEKMADDMGDSELVFFDTVHNYTTLKTELNLWASRTYKYLIFHDTFTDWVESCDAGGEGIGRAITELLDKGEWKVVYQVPFNHGLLVLERIK